MGIVIKGVLSNANPADLAVSASPGTSEAASRADHVHRTTFTRVTVYNPGGPGEINLTGAGDDWNYTLFRLNNSDGTRNWTVLHRKTAAQINDLMFEYYDGSNWMAKMKFDVSQDTFDLDAGCKFTVGGQGGWSGTFTTGTGSTVTVVGGVIANVT